MSKAFRRQKPPPKVAFLSLHWEIPVYKFYTTQSDGSLRKHWLHPTKGWRSERVR